MSSSINTAGAPSRSGALHLGAAGMKLLIVVHRYLGVAMGFLMLLWCLSGFVMMYASYPNLTQDERVQGLPPLQLAGCCDPARIPLDPDAALSEARIEMLLGRPILRVAESGERPKAFDLQTGRPVEELTPGEVGEVARTFGAERGIKGPPGPPLLIDKDQWSISTADRNRPLYRIRFYDPAASEIYVSGASGLVVLDTTRKERILGWLGPVPHWLYPRMLRENNAVWTQVVIWTSTVGVFLTLMGLWIGVVRFRKRTSGRWSPYRGVLWLHHVPGLVLGVLTLTWVFSGLMTMGPWGTLRGNSSQLRREFVGEVRWAEARQMLTNAAMLTAPGTVALETAPMGSALHVLARSHEGGRRLDVSGRATPVRPDELLQAAKTMDAPARDARLMHQEDDYYYDQHGKAKLPVYRVVLGDEGATRLYVDPETGRVLKAAGPQDRARRWIETSLHDLDFAWMRQKPLWDIAVILLLAGVTFICGTGFWLGVRRIGRDFESARAALRKRS